MPLFQRPYVWNREKQWEPLWEDISRMAERYLRTPSVKHHPHFLGAVVLQQVQTGPSKLPERTVIDGQQRLTTLQLVTDVIRREISAAGAERQASRLLDIVQNPEKYWDTDADQLKLLPTNRDRAAFASVMNASSPVRHTTLESGSERLVAAHRYFTEQARQWLDVDDAEERAARADALHQTASVGLQLVVIDLDIDENAQEIFETLNARGSQLTAADLIKNFIFQRLRDENVDVEAAYQDSWQKLEEGFWETEVSTGKQRIARSSIFLNHWLMSQVGEYVPAKEVFDRFKRYAQDETSSMLQVLRHVASSADVYRAFIEQGTNLSSEIDRLGLFAYRTSVLESETFKPVVLALLDPERDPVPRNQLHIALEVLESWLVRRTLVRVTAKSNTLTAAELIKLIRGTPSDEVGEALRTFLARHDTEARYWPDDDELRRELTSFEIFRRLQRGRLRMVLEAIEDRRRGWRLDEEGWGGQRVNRGKYAIEHVMPQSWRTNWPLPSEVTEEHRETLVQTLGNLTLLMNKLNSSASNGPWSAKRTSLDEHDVLMLNRSLHTKDTWSERDIERRTAELIADVQQIWPVPEGHRSGFSGKPKTSRIRVDMTDLIAAGLVEGGSPLYVKSKKYAGHTATLLPDGRIDVDGKQYSSPSAAANTIARGSVNGFLFFALNPSGTPTLDEVRAAYIAESSEDVDNFDTDA